MNPYPTPLAFRAAVTDRARREAAKLGVDLGRFLRIHVVFERFLARLVQPLRHRYVLKGAVALELRLGRARATKDLDLAVALAPENLLPRLQEAGALDLGDYLRYEVVPEPRHPTIDAEALPYGGQRYRVTPFLAGKVFVGPFGLDLALGLLPPADWVRLPGFLGFAGIAGPLSVPTLPLEVHIAEKLHAYTVPRPTLNSRVKDLPDLALLATARSFDAVALRAAIARTFAARRTHAVPQAVPLPPAAWEGPYQALARAERLPWPSLEAATEAVRAFLDPVLAGQGPLERSHQSGRNTGPER